MHRGRTGELGATQEPAATVATDAIGVRDAFDVVAETATLHAPVRVSRSNRQLRKGQAFTIGKRDDVADDFALVVHGRAVERHLQTLARIEIPVVEIGDPTLGRCPLPDIVVVVVFVAVVRWISLRVITRRVKINRLVAIAVDIVVIGARRAPTAIYVAPEAIDRTRDATVVVVVIPTYQVLRAESTRLRSGRHWLGCRCTVGAWGMRRWIAFPVEAATHRESANVCDARRPRAALVRVPHSGHSSTCDIGRRRFLRLRPTSVRDLGTGHPPTRASSAASSRCPAEPPKAPRCEWP